MLTKIELENFKCFKGRVVFPLRQINLLTGINGNGKSTLLQSLLLMRQSIEHNATTSQIILNGKCINLNSFNDIRNTNNSRKEDIVFKYFYMNKLYEKDVLLLNNPELEEKNDEYIKNTGFIEYCLSENLEDDMVAQIKKIEFFNEIEIYQHLQNQFNSKFYQIYGRCQSRFIEIFKKIWFDFEVSIQDNKEKKIEINGSGTVRDLMPPITEFKLDDKVIIDSSILHQSIFSRIHYISADRLGPQEFYLKSTLTSFPNVGAKGELTVNLLYKKKDDLVNENLCLGEDAKTLATQTEEWLNEIFGGAKVEIPNSDSNILELLFNTNKSKDRFKPANVGFGYHCILPIIVSGLIAQPGDILIVENPEAHIHPKAQSRLAQFLARVSSCGVQVFIESHSDHILNALRIAVLDTIVTPQDLSILYLQQNSEQPVVQIPVQPNGGIEEWPEGFFDQMDKDFSRLFGM
ncbi:hypothetical protein B6N60_04592 [Richelia sinica FACHB-800]|uniref:DUF3696 domain-containing protein n=1 Tax=Richelia sinica FACHB-800 TaxID=1357546 RepID=A0A975Y725_9NOST|nr:DUF3696 domain-containing protein [Richelia sinica]MBD2667355.1 DUF3696 domain-containing protein [Richelia sinica FACHB-800]QXE25872.1 hypothetical protein B6N60_04592 [Richelia sinica FACHB-800]